MFSKPHLNLPRSPSVLTDLAAFMVCVISLLVIVTALYSFSYVKEYKGKGAGSMGFFMNLFIASMVALVTSDNAFYFLVFFEMMSLASYFLVLTEQDDNAVNAGLLYFFYCACRFGINYDRLLHFLLLCR